jgi:hypothetical protein
MKRANVPTVSHVGPAHKSTMAEQRQIPGHLSIAPLLLAEGEIPAEVRQALLAGRRPDAAEMLMQHHRRRHAPASGAFLAFAMAWGLEHEDDRCSYTARRFPSPPGDRLLRRRSVR